jgi:hypothetical protein
MGLFDDVDGIKKLTGKDVFVYAFNTNTNEQLLLAHSASIEITCCERGEEPGFDYKLEQGRINIDVFFVMQRQYDLGGYLPTKTHQFSINFVVVDKDGELPKMKLIGCRPASKIPVFLQFAQSTIYKEWTGTAQKIIEVN